MEQLVINFDRIENNPESTRILHNNKKHLAKQCQTLLDAFNRGEHLTCIDGAIIYGFGDMRRRVKDLRDAGYNIKDTLIDGRFKTYYL